MLMLIFSLSPDMTKKASVLFYYLITKYLSIKTKITGSVILKVNDCGIQIVSRIVTGCKSVFQISLNKLKEKKSYRLRRKLAAIGQFIT